LAADTEKEQEMARTSQTPLATDMKPGEALSVSRYFTKPGVDPFDTVQWELRDARIARGDRVAFEQRGVEFPTTWSQNATNIVSQKYFRGQLGSPAREYSVKQMIGRVAGTIADWGRARGYFASVEDGDTFQAELSHVLLHQMAAFNSPVWFNVGFEESPQCSACQPYGALISTPAGMVPIGEIVERDLVGREVYDANGVTRVVATQANGVKPVFRVRLRNGSFVEATADHVVKAVRERRSQPQWLRVDELELGMRMHLHPHRAKVAAPALVLAGAANAADDGLVVVDPLKVSEAALAGWLQADGFVGQYEHGTNRSLTIEFLVADDEERAWVERHLDVVFPDVHRKVRDAGTREVAVQRVRLHGEVLRDFVERYELLARGAEIRVPAVLWTASHEEIAAYLRSIFRADGLVTVGRRHGCENARVAFSVIGQRWTEDVQILLGVLGIYSQRTHKTATRSDRHDLHEVAISIGSERARFAELVGFDARAQGKVIESLDLRDPQPCPDLREEEIVAIEALGEMEVYDIQTESGEYLCNNVAVHNCFILSVEDTMESILDWNTREGKIFLGGSGSGINLSNIRGSMEPLTKGGTASGPVSFMRGADSWAGTIKSGGKTRRAAKMVVLDIDHPDIREFIWCKAKEEKKANALRDAGFDMSIDGEGFISIQYQNANNSVRLTDEFMRAVQNDEPWHLIARMTGEPVGDPIPARELMRDIAEAAWQCADPGVQYDTTINQWHTCPVSGRINASNPCSEYMHVDDSACNLASLNLMSFRRADGSLEVESFEHAVDVMFLAQEIIVGPSSYPTEQIAVNARAFRQLGLGYANLGAYLMSNGMAYDSDQGRATAAAITSLMTARAYLGSARIAAAIGPYEHYDVNREAHNAVMRMHRDASYAIPDAATTDMALLDAARAVWEDAVVAGEEHGYRNAQATVLAPTGTISFLMDCDTTGVEPDFSLVKFKELVGGGQMTIVNQTIPMALRTLGYGDEQIEQIEAYINEHATIVGAPGLLDEHLSVFDVAVGERAISHMGHIKMMGAVQPFISGAISKTVNLPHDASVEDIADAYIQAWNVGVKALAIYRDGSKTAQALRTDAQEGKPAESDVPPTIVVEGYSQEQVDELIEGAVAAARRKALSEAGPKRNRMPRERQSITHKFSIAGHEGYITAGMYEDGTVGEIFLTDIGKEGSTLRGMMNAFATSISIALQYGVPLNTLVEKFSYMRFEPEGITQNPEIPFAKSMPDYIMRWLASRFLDTDTQEELGILTPEVRARKMAEDAGTSTGSSDTNRPANGGNGGATNPVATTSTQPATTRAAAEAMTDSPPVVPARLKGLDLGPACAQCGGMMQRTGSCYTCSSCGNNTGCG
jgi:ribonucleoside-diphosphate reductase alpha chain